MTWVWFLLGWAGVLATIVGLGLLLRDFDDPEFGDDWP